MFWRGRTTSVVLLVLFIGLLITAINIYQLQHMQAMHFQSEHGLYTDGRTATEATVRQKYVVYAKHPDSGYLKHVFNVLERAGYSRANYNTTDTWDVMWAHDYPFKKIRPIMEKLRPGQRVNKFPGSGYITNKVSLATAGLDNVPPAFKIPKEKEKLLAYAKTNPDKMFVQKSNNHRGIKIEKIDNLDLNADGSFVQEFIHNPLLIDGYKFDIGVYTTLTSVDPLRIHVHHSDVLLRFCPEQYHPFDQDNKDKYVVNDDYLPAWKVPSLSKFYNDLGFSFKDTLNAHIRSLGKDPEEMWRKVYTTIADVYRSQEQQFAKAVSHYPHKSAFFEMVRFDFMVDEDLNVYLMEANMSPNLSSAHFPPNKLLYEQVVHSVLRLVGVVSGSVQSSMLHPPAKDAQEMQVSDKDLYVFPDVCASQECSSSSSCHSLQCQLCKNCLSPADTEVLRGAWLEGARQFATRRIYPVPVSRQEAEQGDHTYPGLSDSNMKMHEWYRGKCLMDISWCNK